MKRVVAACALAIACGGGTTRESHEPIANEADPPAPAVDAAVPEFPTRLSAHPTREDFTRALEGVRTDLARAQDELAAATGDRDRENAHTRVERLNVEEIVILRRYHELFPDSCHPLDPACGE